MVIKEFAHAKVNLSLHVTGKRDDGYHLLDSLVAFSDICDVIEISKATATSLTVVGPMSEGVPTDESNLVLQAAALFPKDCTTRIVLHKNLPTAAGIGGGSSDAAATLRAMSQLWDMAVPDMAAQLSLGADVPVCMTPRPMRMQGIGDRVTSFDSLPNLGIILVNPMKPVPTGPVFQALSTPNNPGMDAIPSNATPLEFASWLCDQRNDLETPAIATCAEVGEVLKRLSELNPLLYRMSGSGGTCFALFDVPGWAEATAKDIRKSHPHWWVEDGRLLTG